MGLLIANSLKYTHTHTHTHTHTQTKCVVDSKWSRSPALEFVFYLF